eukprot:TRINITY_DN36916_c0_g1_i2.p1 TRINITY_DN36916_c0_g1~~TRINITY_DN36916_c0_g1_i2.p1  ORF type:complete len:519 (+),score=62.03 TRINITY_DN36916_c0_g1_i2:148-1704(+)
MTAATLAAPLHKAACRLGYKARKLKKQGGSSTVQKLLRDSAKTIYDVALTTEASVSSATSWCEAVIDQLRWNAVAPDVMQCRDLTSTAVQTDDALQKAIHAYVFSKQTDTSDLPLFSACGGDWITVKTSVDGPAGGSPLIMNMQQKRAASSIDVCLDHITVLTAAAQVLWDRHALLGLILVQFALDRCIDIRGLFPQASVSACSRFEGLYPKGFATLDLGLEDAREHTQLLFSTVITGLAALMGLSIHVERECDVPGIDNEATCIEFLGLLKACSIIKTEHFADMRISYSRELLKLKLEVHNRFFFDWRKARDFLSASLDAGSNTAAMFETAESGISTDTSLHADQATTIPEDGTPQRPKADSATLAGRRVARGRRIKLPKQCEDGKPALSGKCAAATQHFVELTKDELAQMMHAMSGLSLKQYRFVRHALPGKCAAGTQHFVELTREELAQMMHAMSVLSLKQYRFVRQAIEDDSLAFPEKRMDDAQHTGKLTMLRALRQLVGCDRRWRRRAAETRG